MIYIVIGVVGYSLSLIVGSLFLGYYLAKGPNKFKMRHLLAILILHLRWKSGRDWEKIYGVDVGAPNITISEYDFWKLAFVGEGKKIGETRTQTKKE
ncbi:MAG: hypothetical protein GF411_08530 [Candidatus Lokiarchaeota archaeon]|nr:hypothetical protein [Candidatus Lokiarchaeota archaeon]